MPFGAVLQRVMHTALSALQAVAKAAIPEARRLRAQRRAARADSPPASNRAETSLNDVLGILTGRADRPGWWGTAVSRLRRTTIGPYDMFHGASLHAWLDDADTRASLLDLFVCEVAEPSRPAAVSKSMDRLRSTWERLVGDHGGAADPYIRQILALARAGLDADLSADPASAALAVHVSATHAAVSKQVADLREDMGDAARNIERAISTGALPDAAVFMLDAACGGELDRIVRQRVIPGCDAASRSAALAADLAPGRRYAACSAACRSRVLCWAARLHALERPEAASAYRARLLAISPGADTAVVDVWLAHAAGDDETALRLAHERGGPQMQAATMSILRRASGTARALAWLDAHGVLSPGLLSPVGWYNAALMAAEEGRWSDGLAWLRALDEDACRECPDIHYVSGALTTAMLFPADLRQHAFKMSVDVSEMRQQGGEAEATCSAAIACFTQAAAALRMPGSEARADGAVQWILWLRLMAPADNEAARAEVADAVRVGARAVDLIDLACTFEVPFDEAPLLAYLSLRELSGRLAPAELAAELQLRRRRDGATEFADFLIGKGQALKEVTTPGGYAALLAHTLMRAGRLDEAETAVRQFQADLGVDADRFRDMLAAARGDDVLPALEERYAVTGNLLDLMAVVDQLGGRNPEKAAGYSAELFRLQRSAIHARRTASALFALDRHAGALEFLEGCPDLVEADLDVAELKAHALYRAGRYKEAGALAARLVSARDSANCVAIEVNVAIACGDWEHLPAILDREYPKRESREASFLLRLASICAQVDPVRAAEMAATAARKEPDNPQILAAAGMLAVQLGRESTGFPLIAAAGRLSSKTGPVRSVGLEDAAVVYGDVVAHQRETEAALARAELPLAFACANLNTSVTQVLVNQGRRNAVLHDWRQRAVVPFRHGGRPLVEISATRTVAADYTALLVLADLDLLPHFGERFDHIVVPWSTAELLMVEARQARFHQPSQVQAARRLRRHLAAVPPRIGVTAAQATAPPSLRAAVGEELASLLVSAAASGGRVLLASRSAISHEAWEKLRNFGYERLFASFADLLEVIRSQGAADSSILEGAISFLSQACGGTLPEASELPNAPIYLDRAAIDYLTAAGLLDSLPLVGRDAFVSEAAAARASALEQTDEEMEVGQRAINTLRAWYAAGLDSGLVSVVPAADAASFSVPASTLMQLAQTAVTEEAVMIEDRAVGRASSWPQASGSTVPLFGIVDLLADLATRGTMTLPERWRWHHRLRQRAYSGIPLLPEELAHWLEISSFASEDASFQPCGELRTLQGYLLRLQSTTFLLQPAETAWLKSIRLAGALAIRRCWHDRGLPVERARAQADWIYANVAGTPMDWRHTLDAGVGPSFLLDAFARQTAAMLPPACTVVDRLQAHADWLQRRVLDDFAASSPMLLDKITGEARAVVQLWRDGATHGHAEVMARWAISSMPPSLRSRLEGDKAFLSECGIVPESWVGFAGGPSVVRIELVQAAQECQRSGRPQTLRNDDGIETRLSQTRDGLELAFTGPGGEQRMRPDFLQLLSADAGVRTAAMAAILLGAGPTGPDPDIWRQAAASGPLGEPDFAPFLSGVQDALPHRIHRARASLCSGELDAGELFPADIAYYEALCGRWQGEEPEAYLHTVLVPHMAAMVERDPVAGLDLCLACHLRDDLRPGLPWRGGDADELWRTLQAVPYRADPFSMLGTLALCLDHPDDGRFSGLACTLAADLCSATLDRGDGQNQLALFPALVDAADAALRGLRYGHAAGLVA